MRSRPNLRPILALACLLLPFSAHAITPKPAPAGAPKPAPKLVPAPVIFDVSPAALLKSAPIASDFPDDGAIMLRDECVIHLNADGTGKETTHQTIKIFNQRGRDKANIAIAYNAATQKISDIHARTIKANGAVLQVSAGDIHETTPFSNFAMYDDAKIIGITMPGVEDGVILDYMYTRTTTKSYLPGQYSATWGFRNGTDPVKLSRLTLTAPTSLIINTQIHNAGALTPTQSVSKDGKQKTYVWSMANLNVLIPEPMMPPARTFLPWLEISTIPTWQTIAHWYQGLASSQMTVSPEIRETVKTLTAGKTSDTEKARAIFYWVEGSTRYVALELGLSAFQPHPATDVCRNRYGDCKDMATLLITMLQEAGIKTTWPVLLGAGRTETVHDYLATPVFFNHAIVRADIDGRPYWFDSTAQMCPFGQIPGGDCGVDAFVIRAGTGTFETIPLGAPEDNRQTTTTDVNLHADGSAECVTKVRLDGPVGLNLRLAYSTLQSAQLRPVLQGLVSRYSPNATLTSYTISRLDDRDAPLVFTLNYHAPLLATKTGHLLILAGKDMTSAPFDRASRTFPIYANAVNSGVEDTTFYIPNGYTLEDKPEDLHVTTSIGEYDQSVTLSGSALTLHLSVTAKPGQIDPSDYAAAKTQYERIVSQRKQPLVLRQVDPAKG